MAYTAWSVVFGEQPTAAKWNQLGTNDAGFKDGTNIDDDAIIQRHIADNQILPAQLTSAARWWEELARVTVTSGTSSSLDTGTITAKKYLMIIEVWVPSGGSNAARLQFNGDTGSNYAFRYNSNGGAESSSVSQTALASGSANSGTIGYAISDFINISNKEKLGNSRETVSLAAGAGTNPDRYELARKWANTSAQITRVVMTSSANTFGVGTELIVLGHD